MISYKTSFFADSPPSSRVLLEYTEEPPQLELTIIQPASNPNNFDREMTVFLGRTDATAMLQVLSAFLSSGR